MNRDNDMIRSILLGIESDSNFNGQIHPVSAGQVGIANDAQMAFAYNVALLIDAGMLTGTSKMASIGQVAVGGITWKGHEFLDTIRDNDVWSKAKSAASKVGGASIALIWELAKSLTHNHLH